MPWKIYNDKGESALLKENFAPELSFRSGNAIPTLVVRMADNELAVAVNGQIAYFRHTEGAPQLNDKVDLSGYLQPGRNIVHLVAVNTSGPAHVDAAIYDRDGGKLMIEFQADVYYGQPEKIGIFAMAALIVVWS
jgi:hypothetical protein